MATLDNDDLNAIKGLIEVTFDEKLDQKLDEKLSHLPTKDEFYTKMDEVMGELKTIKEEQALQSQHLSDHDDRIEKNRVPPRHIFDSKLTFKVCAILCICKFPLSLLDVFVR